MVRAAVAGAEMSTGEQNDDGDRPPSWGRRDLMRAGIAAMAGSLALPIFGDAAQAQTAGQIVTPNPIKAPITKSGTGVQLVDFCVPPQTSAQRPHALINFLYHAGDGSGRLVAADSRGKLWLIDGLTGATSLFLDMRLARGSAFVVPTSPRHTGLRSFACHPDFARAGRPGFGKLYTLSTETPGSATAGVPILGNPGLPVVHHDVIAEWSVFPTNRARVDPRTRREVLRIRMYADDHNADQLMFNPNRQPNHPSYGLMFVGIGDGINFPPHPDPHDQAQNPGSPLGKLLRINPLAQNNATYTVPADNPFVGRSGHLGEIWTLGLRHPENLAFDRGGTGTLVFSDIGQAQIEEINFGRRGANYGWPAREGAFVTDRFNVDRLYARPADDASFGFTYPVAQYDHDEGRAIVGGFVYRGTAIPALAGHYLFGDIVNGRIFHVPMTSLRLGSVATIKELTLVRQGRAVTLLSLLSPTPRVDLRFGQDEAGEIYVLSKQDGIIRKLQAA